MNGRENIAVREGCIRPSYVAQIELLKATGRLYEIGDFDNKRSERGSIFPRSTRAPRTR